MSKSWLALVIGNTRLHWGFFEQSQLRGVWHTSHLTQDVANHIKVDGFLAQVWPKHTSLETSQALCFQQEWLQPARSKPESPKPAWPKQAIPLSSLWIASVVPAQTALWNAEGIAHVVSRSQIPLLGLYPTIGTDRAINLLGAGTRLGWPVLVIDSGTALTFTAGIEHAGNPIYYGGAILPGMRLQEQALAQRTAALAEAISTGSSIFERVTPIEPIEPVKPTKLTVDLEKNADRVPLQANRSQLDLPNRWATDTAEAIASGLAYGTTAILTDYLTNWWQRFPTGKAVLTGGDAPAIYSLLQQRTPAIAARVQVDSSLMFWGMQAYRQNYRKSDYQNDGSLSMADLL